MVFWIQVMIADNETGVIYSFSGVLQPYMLVFYVSFVVTLVLTPMMRFLAHRHGIVDQPDGKRKVHTQPIAYLGGVATFLGWLAGLSVSVLIRPHNAEATSQTFVQIPFGVLLGAGVVVIFGLIDDVYSLSPKLKLFGQFLAALFLVLPSKILGVGNDFFLGSQKGIAWMLLSPLQRHHLIPELSHFDPHVQATIIVAATTFSVLTAIFLIISTCNATNLLDGLDGLCSGVTGVMSIGYLVLAVYLATTALPTAADVGEAVNPTRITLSLALLGAVLGFLPFNFNPASIFMGDTGSMFLGYMCGTMMLLFAQDGMVRWFLAALVIFGLPMLDTLLAIVRRKLNGKPIFSPDSNHFHHFLIKKGFTVRKAVLLSYALAAVFVSFALVIVIIPTRIALGIYMVLFGWLVVSAFKMGMIFQRTTSPLATNVTINTAVITLENTPQPAPSDAELADLATVGS